MGNPEILKPTIEQGVETQAEAAKRTKELLSSAENSVETSPEQQAERVESARGEAKEALLNREAGGAEKRQAHTDATPVLPHATKRQRSDSYTKTMKQIQSEMTASQRSFSKVIHNKTVEKVSDFVGSTAARPNAVLAGSMAATFLTLFVFVIAKQYGYRLSGFETIATFLLGWALGLIYDYARLLFATKR